MIFKKKTYKITKENIFEYKTNQKDEIFAGSKLNKFGFPNYWPTHDGLNHLVFISFVDAQIFDIEKGGFVSEPASFDILDTEKFDQNDPDAKGKARYISALLSPKFKIRGGVYVKGEYYTGKMEKRYAIKLNKAFMEKYFSIEDREFIEGNFDKNKDGVFPCWPTNLRKTGEKIVFSAVNASIKDKKTGKVILDNINFTIPEGKLFDLTKKEDLETAETIFSLLDPTKVVTGFYYRGMLLPKHITNKIKLYFEKAFIKKNFSTKEIDVEFLEKRATLDKNGNLLFYPMHDEKKHKLIVSYRKGSNPFGPDFASFDIRSDEVFDPTKQANQYKVRIIEDIINKSKDTTGVLYLDGVIIPGKEKYNEIMRRKSKVEKALSVRIDGDPDYLAIFNKFTTNDREKLALLADFYRMRYPHKDEFAPKRVKDDKSLIRFDNVNILDADGNFLFEKDYSAEYSDSYSPNETELVIFNNIFKRHSLVRGGVFFKGKNINRNRLLHHFDLLKVKKFFSSSDLNEIRRSLLSVGCPYKMDRKSKMLVHWPTFDRDGKEVILSSVDSDVWFKVSRAVVKAANDMNFDIYRGETFGLVGESGSGKTTISRAILGINKLHKGAIYWKGKLISSGLSRKEAKATKKSIQMIFQDPAASLNERANIDYIVSEGLYNFHLFKNNEERILKVTKMLRSVGLLPEHLSRYPHEFSGGQRQRIGIARALIIEPEFVLADEPISALDVSIRAQVLNLLKKLQNEQSLTYLFIAHDLSIIRYISDRIAVMHNGYIVELGLAEEIYSNPLHPYTKSLLTAIPQPDPRSKNKRVKIKYEQGDIRYDKCHWEDFGNSHFVLVNDELRNSILKSKKK